ncbi:MAG: TPM domain-containing protein [Acidobacteriota bacterium]
MLAGASKVRWAAVACMFAAQLAAYDFTALKPQGHVSDFAGVIDAGTKQQLESYCVRVKDATGAEIALVTLPSLEGEPVEDVANLLYRTWGVGVKGKDEGVMLLLSVKDRRSRLEVGYGLEPVLNAAYAGRLLREMRPALKEQQYGDAFLTAARVLGEKIAAAKNVTIGDAPMPRQRQEQGGFSWGVFFFVVVFIAYGLMLRKSAQRGARYRRRTGGAFGGYDSYGGGGGGSFGGFGGGDSGGGGASSDW